VGARVLVKDQTTTSQNGIYVLVDTDGDWSLVRASDHDTAAEVQAGDFVFVSGGDIYAATGWVQTETVTTLGTDPILWSQFSGAGTFLAGDGLTLTGSVFAVGAGTGITVNTSDVAVDTTVVARKALATIGDNTATSFNVTHNFNTRGVVVSVFDAATYEEVVADIVKTNANTVAVTFATAPGTNAYSVAIIG
jgi:ketosteroid isomerase-like protein